MGSYGISAKEIAEAIEETLDDLEGDFDSKTLKEGLKLAMGLAKTYPRTTDRMECSNCEKMFKMYKTKKDEDNYKENFKCPYCKKIIKQSQGVLISFS